MNEITAPSLPIYLYLIPFSSVVQSKLPCSGKVEVAVFKGALPELLLAEELHMWTVTFSHKYLLLCLFACHLCHLIPV